MGKVRVIGRNMKYNIDNIKISNSLKYRLMFISGAAVHLCFLIVFFSIRVPELGVVNIFSVLMYVLGSFFSVNKDTGNMRFGWMVAFFSEIMIHTVLCVLVIGMEADFYLYLLVILPISAYVLYFSCTIEVFFRTICVFVAVSLVSGSGSVMAVNSFEMFPVCPLSYDDISKLRMINMLSAALMLVAFSLLFVLEVHGLIKDLGRTNEKLKYIATHDELTGLYNRRSIKPLFEELEQSGDRFCVVLGDIDDFKKVNDTYGHDCGDKVLKTVSRVLLANISEGDTACRWGGEELLLIMRGSKEECYERLSAIRERVISEVVPHESSFVKITVTFGFVSCTEADSIEALITQADKLLYEGKTSGKNKIVVKS